ncbi:MAG: protease family protein [Mucilaginibacter sp.]|nr:protease family protein [Mucilaginibacter sp.]
MINPPGKPLEEHGEQMHPGLQFLMFAGIFLVIMIVGNLLGIMVVIPLYGLKTITALSDLNMTAPHIIPALWIIQIVGTTLPIFAAPVFFAYVIVHDPGDYIKPSINFPLGIMLLVLLIMLLSSPTIEVLSNINQQLQLPHFLSGVQKWMEDSEKTAQKVTEAMLHMGTLGDMLFDLAIIGLVTAIAEEFMFRGVLQTIFARWTQNYHAAVWITAILFSAFHMEFFGFLPRLLLGALFGYFVMWSGSIWPAVCGHFINNGTAVIVTYLYQHKIIKLNPDDQHVFNYVSYIFSFAIMLVLLFIYRKIAMEKSQLAET